MRREGLASYLGLAMDAIKWHPWMRDSLLEEVQLRTRAEAKPVVPHKIPKLESIQLSPFRYSGDAALTWLDRPLNNCSAAYARWGSAQLPAVSHPQGRQLWQTMHPAHGRPASHS